MKPTLDKALKMAKTYFANHGYANEIAFEVSEGFTAYINKAGRVSTTSKFND